MKRDKMCGAKHATGLICERRIKVGLQCKDGPHRSTTSQGRLVAWHTCVSPIIDVGEASSKVRLPEGAEHSTTSIYLGGRTDRIIVSEDPRAREMLHRLARWSGCSMSQLVRTLLFDKYLQVFMVPPTEAAYERLPPVSPARRARQNAYSSARRTALASGGTIEEARAKGRAAGEEAAQKARGYRKRRVA